MKKQHMKRQIAEAESSSSERIDIGSYTCSSSLVQSAYYQSIGGCYRAKPYYATIKAKDSGKNIVDFTWRKQLKYWYDGKYKMHTVFDCELDPWFDKGSSASRHLRDIAVDIEIDEAQKLYEKICRSLAANAPVDSQAKLETLVKKAVDSLGLRTKQREWHELAGSDHALDESARKERREKPMKKKYTRKQITEAIAYWENRLKMMTENDHKWNPAIEKIVSSFQPRVHSIEGVSLAEFGSEDPVKLAKKLYASLASKNGLAGTRYVSGGYSHAGFDYHNYLDGDFKLYFNDQPTFTFRHMVLKKRDTEWIPDGNPYDGVCPKTVWRTMANSCAIAAKPGFKMADLKNVEKGMKVVNSWRGQEFEVSDADYPFYTLRWLFQAPYVQSWIGDAEKKYNNYLNFVSYEAGPFLTRKIQSLGAIAGEDLVDMTQQIVKMAGVDRALQPGKGDAGQTAEQFKSMRDSRRAKVLRPMLKRKKSEAAAQSKIAELKKLIGSGITYGELYGRKDFPSIVTAVLTSSKPYHWTSPTADDYHDALYTCSSDVELGRHQYFREDAYNEAFFEEMDAAIEDFIDDAEDLPVDYAGFEGKIVDAADEANNSVDTGDYVEDEEPEPDWYD